MNNELYISYKEADKLGVKSKAKSYIKEFIESFNNSDDRKTWVKQYLETEEHGIRIRHELYESIIFPELLEGYKVGDHWSLSWLAKTAQNIYSCNRLYEQIDFTGDLELLQKCYELDSRNDLYRAALVEVLVRGFKYAIHEWPEIPYIYAPGESLDDALNELSFAKQLDKEQKFGEVFFEVEAILKKQKMT